MANVYVIKRDGRRVPFDKGKIKNAVRKANKEVTIPVDQLSEKEIDDIADGIEAKAEVLGRDMSVEEIQDNVEDLLMDKKHEVARKYIVYRADHTKKRNGSSDSVLLDSIRNIVERKNEEVNQENSNKNPVINSTQRDYMAGEVSKAIWAEDIPKDIREAHEQGIIHWHDADYSAQKLHNCDLVNLEDMLDNGTTISGVKIDRPKSFQTACTVTSQIVAQVASNQYGLCY